MISVSVADFEAWRDEARRLLAQEIQPEQVIWSADGKSLFEEPLPHSTLRMAVPRSFVEMARTVALHNDPSRWALLYRVLFRLKHGKPHLLALDTDDDVRRLKLMHKAVYRDMHKMTAFVRFRRVGEGDCERFVAWYRPDHDIVKAVAPWFARRFGNMRWSILTPLRSAHFNPSAALGETAGLVFGPGVPRSQAPADDVLEALWRDYYAAIFNPARVNLKATTAEMPVRHWATLPEAQIVPKLLAAADARVNNMAKDQKPSAAPYLPQVLTLSALRAAAPECRGCDLYERATQVVFGEGPPDAKIVMVGEQPGDEEDRKGHPFIGPAGRLLGKAMEEAGIEREKVYVTNAVKHFKWIERGKRRIHAKPTGIEISACKPWLEAELATIEPELIVCLGATAAQALLGREFRITADRGRFFPHHRAKEIVATAHPSAILRAMDRYEDEYALFIRDLRLIAAHMAALDKTA